MLNVARMDAFYGKKQVLFGIDLRVLNFHAPEAGFVSRLRS